MNRRRPIKSGALHCINIDRGNEYSRVYGIAKQLGRIGIERTKYI